MTEFENRFDVYYASLQDRRDYLESKGYHWDGFRYKWEPQDPVEIKEAAYGLGAMTPSKLDNYNYSDCEEF